MTRRPTSPTPARFAAARTAARGGFTLNELMVVIAIAVLVIALAVPAFNAITGGRSVESAENRMSAFLAAVRLDAVGVQEPRGVICFVDPATEQIALAEVYVPETGRIQPRDRNPSSITGNPGDRNDDLMIDLVGGRDEVLLPRGVGLKVLPNGRVNSGAGAVNNVNDPIVTDFSRWRDYGVIMFDGAGRLMQEPVQVNRTSALGRRLENAPGMPPLTPPQPVLEEERQRYADTQRNTIDNRRGPLSNIGFALYDSTAFVDLRELPDTTENNKMRNEWMQENAVPYLVNRYNGTLLRGE